ncbi:MAG: Druantia anti-phage system protein DruA, partial [Candidatus Promineifilaceae bacterium]
MGVTLDELLQNPIFDWQTFLTSIEGQMAVRTALHAEKSRYVGTSILEVNVCGAIPPYNHLLGGKLVALLMLSPRVVADYRQRYGGRESDIASRMKGEAVVKPAELVYVGT